MFGSIGGRTHRSRLTRAFLVACISVVTLAGCGGSSSSPVADDTAGDGDVNTTKADSETTVADPFKTPDPVQAELGKPAKVGDVEDGKYVTITIEKVLDSNADEADPNSLRVELDATASSNAVLELSASVWCDSADEAVPQSGTLGGDGWNAFASGGMISFEPDEPSSTEPLIVRVPTDCKAPALELTPATVEGQLASTKTPVRWTLTGLGA